MCIYICLSLVEASHQIRPVYVGSWKKFLSRWLTFVSSIKYDRLCPVYKDPVLTPPFDRSAQYLALDVTALVDEFLGGHVVIDTGNSLLDDGALVEVGGDKMGGGANDLDATVISLMVGFGALEAGEERVVDIDDLARHDGAEIGR